MAVAEAIRPLISLPIEEPKPYTSEDFEQFASAYPELRLEMTREGELVIMAPAGGETGNWNADLTADLVIWNRIAGTGRVFDSSTGFVLPNGAKRSPDASWIELTRWESLTPEQRKKFLPLCPDFALELRSATDRLSSLQTKMREYIDNGVKLGWLIDPISHRVEIYRPDREVEVLDNPASVSGETVLPGFTLNLKGILN